MNLALEAPRADEAWWSRLTALPFRHLDVALVRFVMQRDPLATPGLLLAVAWLAHLEGRGHTCLNLALMHAQPEHELVWPAEHTLALSALRATLPPTLEEWQNAIAASLLVWVADGDRPDLGQPFVLARTHWPRFYLRRYWRWEQMVAHALVARTRIGAEAHTEVEVSAQRLRPWLQRLFVSAPRRGRPSRHPPEPNWQQLACAMALRSPLTLITGGPGTGKTYTAARVLAVLLATAEDPDRVRIALAAPTGKAAARLKQSIDTSLQTLGQELHDTIDIAAVMARIGPATTLHRLLGASGSGRSWRHDAANPLPLDVLIVDEASMIHLEMMAALLVALPLQARLIVLGDKDQLDSVEAGAVLGDLCRDAVGGHYTSQTRDWLLAATGSTLPDKMVIPPRQAWATTALPPLAQHTVMLRHSRRFEGPIGELAQSVNEGHEAKAVACLRRADQGVLVWHIQDQPQPHAAITLAVSGRPTATGQAAGYAAYAQLIRNGWSSAPPHRTGDATNQTAYETWVHRVLDAFERVRVLCATRDGPWGVTGLNEAIAQALTQGGHMRASGEWYAGRPVMITRNDPDLGVFNGDIGLVLPAPTDGRWRVYFRDGPHLRWVGAARLAYIDTAFALTVHKSQGSEFDHTILVLPQAIGPLLNRPLAYTGITRAKTALSLVTPHDWVLRQALRTQASRHSGLAQALSAATAQPDGAPHL